MLTCRIEGCNGARKARGFCKHHYYQDRRDNEAGYREHERNLSLIRKYGIDQAAFDAMLAAQGGVCAICRTESRRGRGGWCVDHDHACCPTPSRSCGKCIRGILCLTCNSSLGWLENNRDGALAYLAVTA